MAGRDETVFQPFPPRKNEANSTESDHTLFQPSSRVAPQPENEPLGYPAPQFPGRAPVGTASPNQAIVPGYILDQRFRVERLLGQEFESDVFAGVSIINGEKVTIKAVKTTILGSPQDLERFRSEIQSLTKLSHPALISYLEQIEEPNTQRLLILARFISGTSLLDALGNFNPSPQELLAFTLRLAEGLNQAHQLGILHCGISPDKILLENGDLEKARIVGFDIGAKATPEARTMMGPNFAGGLRYAAPEQLGDFGGEIGPWSDVFTLGLMVLALSEGKIADLGGSPVEAIRKRRTGIDTSGAPKELRPLLDKMLATDPKLRFQSMTELISAITKLDKAINKRNSKDQKSGASSIPRVYAILGSISAAVILLTGMVAFVLQERKPSERQVPLTLATKPTPAGKVISLSDLDSRVRATLPSIGCSWVTVASANGPSGVTLTGSGIAGRPEEVEPQLYDAVKTGGINIASSDFSGISPIDTSYCPMLDALRSIRDYNQAHIMSAQSRYELDVMTEGPYAGKKGAHVIVDLSLADISSDFALYSIEKSKISEIFPSRAAFLAAAPGNQAIERLPGTERYRLQLDGTPQTGWSGILLLTGNSGFSQKVLENLNNSAGRSQFEHAAHAGGWKAQMIWYKFVDELPDTAVTLPTSSAPPAPSESATGSGKAK